MNAFRDNRLSRTHTSHHQGFFRASLVDSSAYLLKLHGDYKDARILNTEAELSGYPSQYDALLDRIMDEYGLIVCGWSGEWDHALRSAIKRTPSRRYPMYWAARGAPGIGAAELIEQRRAQVLDINGADNFFEGIDQRVQSGSSPASSNAAT
ncbi:hypothetical protein [Rhizobium sp. 2MFCol3.1]|uniref:hypothetical protein n=1 Tax=Rhizobium sp. 2MFCol3.1 TaxID=1246459 RepID=UPI00036E0E7A|nr:hypothetical protein [Rhizobium sp. 2MFCol3.1]